MTEGEARTVLCLLMTADGGCHDCAGKLAARFVEAFPVYRFMAGETFRAAFPERDLSDYISRRADNVEWGYDE